MREWRVLISGHALREKEGAGENVYLLIRGITEQSNTLNQTLKFQFLTYLLTLLSMD